MEAAPQLPGEGSKGSWALPVLPYLPLAGLGTLGWGLGFPLEAVGHGHGCLGVEGGIGLGDSWY